MWPYSKIKHTQPELKQAGCPDYKGPTTAEHHRDGTIFTNTCPNCRTINYGVNTEGDKVGKGSDLNS